MNNYRRRNGLGPAFFLLIMISALAILTGYAGAKYLLYPYLSGESILNPGSGGTTSGSSITTPGIIVDQQDIKDLSTEGTSLNQAKDSVAAQLPVFSIQFGSFGTLQAAETLANQLKTKEIPCYCKELNGAFKVFGMSYLDKDSAKVAAESMKGKIGEVYVSSQTLLFSDETRKTSLESLLKAYQNSEGQETSVSYESLQTMQEAIMILMNDLS